jgi:hypothetical protein
VGIVFTLVESSTFYGAVARGAAAGDLLVGSETAEGVDDHRLIYDLEDEPASQLVDQWPSLPDATTVTSAAGEQLLTAIRDRMGSQSGTTFVEAQETEAHLYDESGTPSWLNSVSTRCLRTPMTRCGWCRGSLFGNRAKPAIGKTSHPAFRRGSNSSATTATTKLIIGLTLTNLP